MNRLNGIGITLCIVSAAIIAAEIYYGIYQIWGSVPKAILLPVSLIVFLFAGIGLFLGWIMATTPS